MERQECINEQLAYIKREKQHILAETRTNNREIRKNIGLGTGSIAVGSYLISRVYLLGPEMQALEQFFTAAGFFCSAGALYTAINYSNDLMNANQSLRSKWTYLVRTETLKYRELFNIQFPNHDP